MTSILEEGAVTLPVTVKPLEWHGGFAHTGVGMYFYLTKEADGCILERHEGSSTIKSFYPTEAAAKTGAQTKFAEAILATLSPSTDIGETYRCDVSVLGIVDGMDQPTAEGSYVKLMIVAKNGMRRSITASRGGADALAAELYGVASPSTDIPAPLPGSARQIIHELAADIRDRLSHEEGSANWRNAQRIVELSRPPANPAETQAVDEVGK